MNEQNEQPTLKTFANGSKEWRLNGQLHREDGPARELFNGTKFWFQNDQLHHLDGPAIEFANGSKEWWINGKQFSESEFKRVKKLQTKEPKEKPLSFFNSLIL